MKYVILLFLFIITSFSIAMDRRPRIQYSPTELMAIRPTTTTSLPFNNLVMLELARTPFTPGQQLAILRNLYYIALIK